MAGHPFRAQVLIGRGLTSEVRGARGNNGFRFLWIRIPLQITFHPRMTQEVMIPGISEQKEEATLTHDVGWVLKVSVGDEVTVQGYKELIV